MPELIPAEMKRLRFDDPKPARLTHYLFRYPAKFHAPVIRTLLSEYTRPDDCVLDPFCGSGSLLVEASVMGRNAIGFDVDPVAVFVSRIKTKVLDVECLSGEYHTLCEDLVVLRRSPEEYMRLRFEDISVGESSKMIQGEHLWVPDIPNLLHWFRRYVVVDLARINSAIVRMKASQDHKEFFRLCLASMIRSASNADPVPVSGLEVTAHMRRRDALGRVVDPFELFHKSTVRALSAMKEYAAQAQPHLTVEAHLADATSAFPNLPLPVSAVITSPPYHNAVDYYRRHQLEMYWLGLTTTHNDRLTLLPRYIGRPKVPKRHPFVSTEALDSPLASAWETRMRQHSARRADAFKHYAVAMRRAFLELAKTVTLGTPVLFIVGHSAWNGSEIPTTSLFLELALPYFNFEDILWYPIANRYMSYSRHNGANINTEYVLIFKRSSCNSTLTSRIRNGDMGV